MLNPLKFTSPPIPHLHEDVENTAHVYWADFKSMPLYLFSVLSSSNPLVTLLSLTAQYFLEFGIREHNSFCYDIKFILYIKGKSYLKGEKLFFFKDKILPEKSFTSYFCDFSLRSSS